MLFYGNNFVRNLLKIINLFFFLLTHKLQIEESNKKSFYFKAQTLTHVPTKLTQILTHVPTKLKDKY